jgi:hypothetical protein
VLAVVVLLLVLGLVIALVVAGVPDTLAVSVMLILAVVVVLLVLGLVIALVVAGVPGTLAVSVMLMLAVVVVLVLRLVIALVVAGVPDTLAVSVMLVAVAVAVVLVVALVLVLRAAMAVVIVSVVVVILAGRLGLLADAGLGRRGDAAAAWTGGGRDSRATRGSDGRRRSCAGVARRWGLTRAEGGCRAAGAWRLGGRQRRRDDGGDLTRSGRRSRDRGLVTGQIEKPWRGQNEPNRRQYGEQADHGCGYARKTTPHKYLIGAPAPELNFSRGRRTSRPLRENSLQHEGVRRGLGDPSIPL